MLKEIELNNFRGFQKHKIPFHKTTIVVGKNNAGKSTLIEALRLIAIVTQKHENWNMVDPPAGLELPLGWRGFSPSLKDYEFNFTSLFYRYGEPPAEIAARFDSGESIKIFLGADEKVHCVFFDAKNQVATTRGQIRRLNLPSVYAMPQVAPLAAEETVLDAQYVNRHLFSPRSHLHFRNQLNCFPARFEDFKTRAHESWPGLRIRDLQGQGEARDTPLTLLVEDDRFVAEVGWMGHGLQIWLQTVWFLSLQNGDIIILDEPDVYLHADVQRRLIRFLREQKKQLIVTTHSLEIMAEVEPDEIVILDRKRKESNFALSLPAVQKVVENIGSAHNLHLTRLWNAQRCLFLEGKDLALLRSLYRTLFPGSDEAIEDIPNMSIGGWSGWRDAVGTAKFLQNAVGVQIEVYCLFDSDYHTPDTIARRLKEAREGGIRLHIWGMKEIENYLLVPSALARLIGSKVGSKKGPTEAEVEKVLQGIANGLKAETMDDLANEILLENRSNGLPNANAKAREVIDSAWKKDRKLWVVSGKKALSQFFGWSQKKFGVSLNPVTVARNIEATEISDEMREFLTSVKKNTTFPKDLRTLF